MLPAPGPDWITVTGIDFNRFVRPGAVETSVGLCDVASLPVRCLAPTTLSQLDFEHNLLSKIEISNRLGTNFYKTALYTKGGILLHPGKLARAMIDVLPNNIVLYENSSVLNWDKKKDNSTGQPFPIDLSELCLNFLHCLEMIQICVCLGGRVFVEMQSEEL